MTETAATSIPNLKTALDHLVREAIAQVTGLPPERCHPYLAQAKNPQFGDYQSNAMMALAKQLKTNPRELGQKVCDAINQSPEAGQLLEKCELAGPGFLNLHLSQEALQTRLTPTHLTEPMRLPEGERQTVVVDYSSPNVAKEMHVGHIRSTILGDAIARILEHLGHRVIRQNHLGDWGTQFGMLLAYYRRHPERLDQHSQLANIEENYRQANDLFKSDPIFEKEAREAVVQLHNQDPDALALWEKIVNLSRRHLHENYARLQVRLGAAEDCGESFYNPKLPSVVQQLKDAFAQPKDGVRVVVNDGAVCVFLENEDGTPRFKNANDEPLPFLIQKSDGAFLYATTDLAALKYRADELQADWIIYVTDNRQALHFEMLFATAHATGLDRLPNGKAVKLQHITFGSILGQDKKPLKTRDGGTVKLSSLLEEAVERASEKVAESNLVEGAEKEEIAEKIGIGAIKYADLSQNRQTDYIFTWEKLLALEGNTAAYLMYAYARLSKMLRESKQEFSQAQIHLTEEAERRLALALCRFPETLESLTGEWRLNALTDHLYSTASALMKFYDECPVLKESDPKVRASRLLLCQMTAQVLKTGLGLLGISTVDRM